MNTFDYLTSTTTIDNLPLLNNIPRERKPTVLRCIGARISYFKKGDILAGHIHNSLFTRYLIAGKALILHYDATGNRSILEHLQENSVISSELAPQFYSKSSLDIIATEPCITLDFHISEAVENRTCCIKYINRLKGNIIASLTDTNMQLIKRLNMLSNRSTREKILAYLQEQSQKTKAYTFTIPYNRQELADYLYIERSALSRELSRMQREGLIVYTRNRFTLLQSRS